MEAKYVHTNIVARDWRGLADFYVKVFGCTPVSSERHYEGDWVTKVTTIPNVSLEGMHLRLPGYEGLGPTLEIFQYSPEEEQSTPTANRHGFGHIAFHVDDVAAGREEVLAAGGRDLGEIHTMDVPGAGTITLVYMTDPEGNIIELQHWSA